MRGFFKVGLALFIISIISKLMGFFREVLIANYFGISYSADAYYVALTPATLAITFSIVISSVFLPLFVKNSRDRNYSFLFANSVLSMFLIGVSFFYINILIFTDFFINLLAPGLPPEAETTSITLIKYLFPIVFIVIAIQIYTLMLNTFEDYVASAASILPNNLIIIIYFWIYGNEYGITGVAVVTLIANLAQLFILYYLLRKHHKYRIIHSVKVWSPDSKVFMLLFLPVLVSSGFSQLNSVIDRLLASSISEGAIASLSYAFRLRGIVTGIFIAPIITLTFPKLAKHSQNQNYSEVSDLTHKSVFSVFILLIPLTIMFLFFYREIIQVLFERGNFDSDATTVTSEVFWAYSIGILAIGFREVTLRAFYSYGDTKTPTFIMIIGSLTNIGLSYLLIKPFGLMGLGLSASISFVISSCITIILLKRNLDSIWSRAFVSQMLKLVVASAIVSVSIFYLKYGFAIDFSSNKYTQLIGLGVYGIFSYVLFLFILLLLKEKAILGLLQKLLIKKTIRK